MKAKASAKDRILDVAADLFHKRGYKEVGINEIIEKSGTAKATFYSNFKSKEKLGEAWLQQVHDFSESQRAALLDNLTDPKKVIANYFKGLEKFLRDGGFRGCPYTNTAAVLSQDESCLVAQIHEHKDSVREFFRQLARHSVKPAKKANILGDRMFLLYSGATTECQNLQRLWPVGLALDTCMELWAQSLEK